MGMGEKGHCGSACRNIFPFMVLSSFIQRQHFSHPNMSPRVPPTGIEAKFVGYFEYFLWSQMGFRPWWDVQVLMAEADQTQPDRSSVAWIDVKLRRSLVKAKLI